MLGVVVQQQQDRLVAGPHRRAYTYEDKIAHRPRRQTVFWWIILRPNLPLYTVLNAVSYNCSTDIYTPPDSGEPLYLYCTGVHKKKTKN